MKRIRKTALFLMILSLAFVSAAGARAASVYTPVTPSNATVNHTMELTQAPYHLDYTITYSFTADDDPTVSAPSGLSASEVITGTPAIASVSYGPGDDFASAAGHTITKTAAVDWSGVTFSEPGVYYWKITKAADNGGAPLKLSNNYDTTYLFAVVTDVNGVLTAGATGLSTTDKLETKVELTDQYPATAVDLSLSKTVAGTQGSKDQYFKFTVNITPAGSATRAYTISGYDAAATVNASPYNEGASQPSSPLSLTGGTQSTVTVWLKHGQTFKIEDLPYGSSYTITEADPDYDSVSTAVTGDNTNTTSNDIASGTSFTVTDSSVTANTTVAYTNTKNAVVPTGVTLENGAAFAGILLALALAFLAAFRRRREA